jgi:hypothetical protein
MKLCELLQEEVLEEGKRKKRRKRKSPPVLKFASMRKNSRQGPFWGGFGVYAVGDNSSGEGGDGGGDGGGGGE